MKNLAIFASGSGTNAEAIIRHFQDIDNVSVKILFSNKPDAFALVRAANLGVKTMTFSRADFYESTDVIDRLRAENVDFIVLAGFLWLVPDDILREYEGRIINIHPSLLPAYGGRGMYGSRVHEAVIAAGEAVSGITIHSVNGVYDSGDIIFQASTDVLPTDTPDSLAHRIHELEHKYFPAIIEKIVTEA